MTSRLGLFSSMVVATVAALGSVGCQKGPASPPIASATGRVASTDQLLEEIFASLEDLRTLDTVAQRASSTPGVGSVQHDQNAHALQIDFAPPIAAEDVAVLAGWSETFLVESRRDHSWFLVVYDRQSRHGGSYNQVSFNVPEHGRWRVVAVAARRPTGPPPDISSGASGAYPLADYPIPISSIVIQPLEGS